MNKPETAYISTLFDRLRKTKMLSKSKNSKKSTQQMGKVCKNGSSKICGTQPLKNLN